MALYPYIVVRCPLTYPILRKFVLVYTDVYSSSLLPLPVAVSLQALISKIQDTISLAQEAVIVVG